jgi:transposase
MTARALFGRPLNSITHTDFLRLPGIITTEVVEADGLVLVQAEVAEPITICPNCGQDGKLKGDGAPTQSFWDFPHGNPCYVTLRKQLYTCDACHKPCTHNLDFLAAPKARLTARLRDCIHSLLDLGMTYSNISGITGPAERTIRDIRDERDAERAKTLEKCDECQAERAIGLKCLSSGFIGLDNWKHGKRKKMRGILTDIVRRIPIDLFSAVTKKTLVQEFGAYLAAHPEVRVIVIDMDKGFREVIQKKFPWLIIVVDNYHVKQALEKRVSRICDDMAEAAVTAEEPQDIPANGNLFGEDASPQGCKAKKVKSKKQKKLASLLKKYRKVFMKKPDDRTPLDAELIRACAASYPLLERVLERRDAFYRIWETEKSSEDAQSKFNEWKQSLTKDIAQPIEQVTKNSEHVDQISEQLAQMYRSFVDMIQSWRKEIFAFFDFPERPTNAFTESMVREVKAWNNAGRYVSFPVLRERFRYYEPKAMRSKPTSSPTSILDHDRETPK